MPLTLTLVPPTLMLPFKVLLFRPPTVVTELPNLVVTPPFNPLILVLPILIGSSKMVVKRCAVVGPEPRPKTRAKPPVPA